MVCFVGILREDGSIDNVVSIKRFVEIVVIYVKVGIEVLVFVLINVVFFFDFNSLLFVYLYF